MLQILFAGVEGFFNQSLVILLHEIDFIKPQTTLKTAY